MEEFPVQTGSYALILELTHSLSLKVGRLGSFELSPGIFIYLGSARGPGGIRARLGRHWDARGRIRWHIDYLRRSTIVRGFGILLQLNERRTGFPMECRWSQQLLSLPSASVPIPGFGASDCRSGCPAHLFYFKHPDILERIPVIFALHGNEVDFRWVILG